MAKKTPRERRKVTQEKSAKHMGTSRRSGASAETKSRVEAKPEVSKSNWIKDGAAIVGYLSKEALWRIGSKWDTVVDQSLETGAQMIKVTVVVGAAPGCELDLCDVYRLSTATLPKYATLDLDHRRDIKRLMNDIADYAVDLSKRRPHCVIMHAAPGTGKSHFIDCVTDAMTGQKVEAITFNMTSMDTMEDIVGSLDAARNTKMEDNLPLLFLDEFDSDPKNFARLLPLLWDGKLRVGHRELKMGKIVIVLAGSSKMIETAISCARRMKKDIPEENSKLVDLLSRINGGELRIPRLDSVGGTRDRRVDKVCVCLALIEKRFRKAVVRVPWSLLAFVARCEFRYGVRSIAHLVDLLPNTKIQDETLKATDLALPLGNAAELTGSGLVYHVVDEKGATSVVKLCKGLSAHEDLVRFRPVVPNLMKTAAFKKAMEVLG